MSLIIQKDWNSPPGATVLDALKARSIDVAEFAQQMGYPRESIDRLITGDLVIDWDMAVALADNVGASPKFWLQRQADFDLDRHIIPATIAPQIREWLKSLPVSDMVRFGWLPAPSGFQEKASNCFQFFGVRSVAEWEERYAGEVKAVAFRSSASLESDIRATVAWLRKGEIEAGQTECAAWDKEKFIKALDEIKPLTRVKSPADFLPKLKKIASDCGVVVVVSRSPKGCRASGATKFIDKTRALMMLSFRHRSDDHFWFTFFHEAAHLILHDESHLFLENGSEVEEICEAEANDFAQNFLIPVEYRSEMESIRRDFKAIVRFARRIGVSHGIVVGQLQFLRLIDRSWLNRLKQRYDWDEIEAAINL